jgi:transposase
MSVKNEKKRRKRREFSEEFKAEAVRRVVERGQPASQVAKELDLTESALHRWIRLSKSGKVTNKSSVISGSEREELEALRREVRQLKMEREILRKATAFFAKEQI